MANPQDPSALRPGDLIEHKATLTPGVLIRRDQDHPERWWVSWDTSENLTWVHELAVEKVEFGQ